MASQPDVASPMRLRFSPAGLKQPASGPNPTCPMCNGLGWLRVGAPFGDPSFGKSAPCACSEAQRTARDLQGRYHAANLDAFRESTFKTFNSSVLGVQEAFRVCADFALNPRGWLLLMGPCGCGKTHLAAALANQLLERGTAVFFTSVPDLLDALRAALSSYERYTQFFDWVREIELLVLDDFGAQQSSAWSNEKLLQLFDARANSARHTVITTIPKALQGLDERLRSRLSDTQLVTMVLFEKASDFRPRKLPPARRTGP